MFGVQIAELGSLRIFYILLSVETCSEKVPLFLIVQAL